MLVQIGVNLQPDYYMKNYRTQVVQTAYCREIPRP